MALPIAVLPVHTVEVDSVMFQSADLRHRFHDVLSLHSKSKIFEAEDKLKCLVAHIKKQTDAKVLLAQLYQHPSIIRIQRECARASAMLTLLQSVSADWKLLKNDGVWSTEYRREHDSEFHSFRVKGEVEADMVSILAMFYEMDLIQKWMPLSKDSYEIEQFSLYNKCGYVRIGAMWPIRDRELVVFGFGIDDLDANNCFGFVFDTNVKPYEALLRKLGVKLPAVKHGAIRIDINIGGFLMERIEGDAKRIRLSSVFNVDPKVPVPTALLNAVVGRLAGVFLSSIVRAASRIDSDPAFTQRMKHNAEFYEAMQQKNKHCSKEQRSASKA